MKSANFPEIGPWKSCEIWFFFLQPTRSPEKSHCLTNKSENTFNVVTKSVWTPMSVSMLFQCMDCKRFWVYFTQDFRSKFFFQYDPDRMWPVNMTGKTKGWPVNFPISPDIVHWPAVISSFALYINLYSVRFYCYLIFLQLYMFLHRELMNLCFVHRFVVLVLEALYPQHFVFFTSCLH